MALVVGNAAQALLDEIQGHRAFQLLPRDERLWLEARPLKMVDWAKRERWLCQQDTGWHYDESQGFPYWIERYGVVVPVSGGEPESMEMFEAQRRLMVPALVESDYVVFGKTRRFGATTIDTHHTSHLMAINKRTINIDCFASSNNRDNAYGYADRVKTILDAQPSWLSVPIGKLSRDPDTGKKGEESKSVLEIRGRGTKGNTLTSVAAGPSLRSVGARKYTGDEAAFPPPTLPPERWITSALPTRRGGGQCVFISTGNGDENTKRPGRAFAKIVRQGQRGEGGVRLIFISRDDDPNFKQSEWDEVAAVEGPAAADAEFPRTVEEMLRGDSEGKAYDATHVTACLELGRLYKASVLLGEGWDKESIVERLGTTEERRVRLEKWLARDPVLPEPVNGEIWAGVDWEKRSAWATIWPLGGFVRFVRQERQTTSAGEAAEVFVGNCLEMVKPLEDYRPVHQLLGGNPGRHLAHVFQDASGFQQSLTLKSMVPHYTTDPDEDKVPFGSMKKGFMNYLRTLMRRTDEWIKAFDADEPTTDFGLLALDPEECKLLSGQLYALEIKDGVVVKQDDHLHDALGAGLAHDGIEWVDTFLNR